MANAWGVSWQDAWGASWGSGGAPVTTIFDSGGIRRLSAKEERRKKREAGRQLALMESARVDSEGLRSELREQLFPKPLPLPADDDDEEYAIELLLMFG